MQKMKETMISKNVASEIAEKLCDSVAQKLQGKVVGTFSTISATVRQSLTEACVQVRGGAVDIRTEQDSNRQTMRPQSSDIICREIFFSSVRRFAFI